MAAEECHAGPHLNQGSHELTRASIDACLLQSASLAHIVNGQALPGSDPERLEFALETEMLPAQLSAKHAEKYHSSVHPVGVKGTRVQ